MNKLWQEKRWEEKEYGFIIKTRHAMINKEARENMMSALAMERMTMGIEYWEIVLRSVKDK